MLFNLPSNNGYWTAQGCVEDAPENGVLSTTNKSSAAVRCVYDEWYWGDSKVAQDGNVGTSSIAKYPFRWGDE